MTEPTNESVREGRERQTRLLADLRAAGRTTEADQLSVNYHGLQMAGLAQDAYRAAAGTGAPPPGWTRASEHPEQLQALAPGLSREQINEMLRPEGSGFRAEIYLPDPAILGPDARPVFAVKGSMGSIVDPASPGGRRASGAEDYLSNNFPQGLGLRADYYDRAMDAARLLQRQPGLDFEITGHSLGGGIASAAGAVTGVQTTTFNAAGLHPNTAARYVEENGGAVHDLRATITAFQVNGDVLTDIQTGVQGMSDATRIQTGRIANGLAQIAETPGLRELTLGYLETHLPPNARASAMAAVDLVATESGAQLLRDVPTAAGNVQPLMDARKHDGGALVDRPQQMPVSELATYAGPLVDVLDTAVLGSRIGRGVGEGVQVTGQGVEQVLHYGGTALDYTARIQGETVATMSGAVGTIGRTAVLASGEVVAEVRTQVGNIDAGIDLARGHLHQGTTSAAASFLRFGARALPLPDDVERWLGRQAQGLDAYGDSALAQSREEARRAVEAARADAGRIREGANGVAGSIDNGAAAIAVIARQTGQQVGGTLQDGTDAAGCIVRGVTDQAPAAGAVVGTGFGLVGGVALNYGPQNPYSLSNIQQTVTFAQNLVPSGREALARHMMEDAVIPSLESVVRTQEDGARVLLQASRAQNGASPPSTDAPVTAPAASPLLDDAAHPNNGMYRDAQSGVNALGAPFDAMSQPERNQLAGALVADSVDAGLTRIARVDPGAGNGRIFASDNPDPSAAHNRIAGTDVAQGQAQPLAASTQHVDRVHERAAEQAAQPPQQQTQNDPQQETAPRKVA